jgi:hypothetical protein
MVTFMGEKEGGWVNREDAKALRSDAKRLKRTAAKRVSRSEGVSFEGKII